ncbi:hypothetical protein WJX72_007742 [[Myrmecia] bisecta]|uniref:Inhibitor of growth protein N-terminal histone-binding domain-containing protein n=1 Tax=[Myrmecia] bisecta TaxID=41462 RepID=A0AAW1PDE9_9CHLO
MNNTIIYLENYVESTGPLPAELQRILNTIKDLDERSQVLADMIRANVDLCLSKPSQATRKIGSENANEVADLRKQIENDQRMLIQWAEEKMQLALTAYDLVDIHLTQLDKDLEGLTDELQAADALEDSMVTEVQPSPEELKRQRQREEQAAAAAAAAAAAEQERLDAKRREREAEQERKRSAAAAAAAAAAPAPAQTLMPGADAAAAPPPGAAGSADFAMPASRAPAPSKQPGKGKREKEAEALAAAQAAAKRRTPPVHPGSSAPQHIQQQQQQLQQQHLLQQQQLAAANAGMAGGAAQGMHAGMAGAHMHGGPRPNPGNLGMGPMAGGMAGMGMQGVGHMAGHAGMGPRGGMGGLSHPGSLAGMQHMGSSMGYAPHAGGGMGYAGTGLNQMGNRVMSPGGGMGAMQGMPGDVGMAAEEPIGFSVPIPPGMSHSAASPQAPGRLLVHTDINHNLKGRLAELFWPDDDMWYLIEIHDVNVEAKLAKIAYSTGETEELDLNEIVREGHMSLITARF